MPYSEGKIASNFLQGLKFETKEIVAKTRSAAVATDLICCNLCYLLTTRLRNLNKKSLP